MKSSAGQRARRQNSGLKSGTVGHEYLHESVTSLCLSSHPPGTRNCLFESRGGVSEGPLSINRALAISRGVAGRADEALEPNSTRSMPTTPSSFLTSSIPRIRFVGSFVFQIRFPDMPSRSSASEDRCFL